jgi:predicted SprT family Zn-dependent metalloprotease
MNKLIWAEKTAVELMEHYLPGWTFVWNDTKSFMGQCCNKTKVINLSKTFTLHRTLPETLDTILHEIAHGMTPTKYKPHGAEWKSQAVMLGAKPVSCATKDETTLTPEQLKAKWVCINKEGKVIDTWQRKPRATTFAKLPYMYEVHRKAETTGTLRIITIEDYKKEFGK